MTFATFLRKFCRMHNCSAAGFTGRAIDHMLSYHWPGNIRELENVVERGVILAPDGGAIDSTCSPAASRWSRVI